MLTIHTATSAAAVKAYFSTADYYSQGTETVGLWGGKAADMLGLVGRVDKEAFNRLCDNVNPVPVIDADGNERFDRLTPRTNDSRRVGYDMVFSAPKSFSVIEAFAGGEERLALRGAFDAAILETMEELEGDMQVRVRKGGAFHDRPTGNLLWAEFDHSTSRPLSAKQFAAWRDASGRHPDTANGSVPPDPHWHKHVFCFNATFDPVEGRFKAGEFSYAKRDAHYYEAVFYSRLTKRLEAMGYPVERLGGNRWELAGTPSSVVECFSKRTSLIEQVAGVEGVFSPARLAELGAKTRVAKHKEMTPGELSAAWRDQLSDAERDGLAKVHGKVIEPGKPVDARQAVAFAFEHISERRSVAPEREFKRVALLHGLGRVTPEEVTAELPRQGLITESINGRVMATTDELQAEERYLIGVAAKGRGAVCPIGISKRLTRELDGGKKLNDEQWRATTGLLESSNRVEILLGPAGAGKSFSLQKLRDGVELAGETVTFLGTTATSVKELEKDHLPADTVARFLIDEKMQNAAGGGRLVVDEASMLGHKDTVKLFRLAEKLDLKLIFIGDRFQHGSVAAGSLFKVLEHHAGIRPFSLRDIQRQQDPHYLAAARLLSEGKTLEGIEAFEAKEWVKEIEDDAERWQAIAGEYVAAVGQDQTVLVISPTHAEAGAITDAIRTRLKAAGKLGEVDTSFTRLVAANATLAERKEEFTYRPGDVIQFHQNVKGHAKGERLVVTDLACVPFEHAEKFSLYRRAELSLAAGDEIRFTGSVKAYRSDHTYRNGDTRGVSEITPGGNIRLDDGRIIDKAAGHIQSAFVTTSYGSQGRTVDRVIIDMSSASASAINQEQIYVSASRGKKCLSIYTDDREAMKDAARRSSRKLAALDVRPKPRPAIEEHRHRRHRFPPVRKLRAAWDRWREPPRPLLTPEPVTLPPAHRLAAEHRQRDLGHGR